MRHCSPGTTHTGSTPHSRKSAADTLHPQECYAAYSWHIQYSPAPGQPYPPPADKPSAKRSHTSQKPCTQHRNSISSPPYAAAHLAQARTTDPPSPCTPSPATTEPNSHPYSE